MTTVYLELAGQVVRLNDVARFIESDPNRGRPQLAEKRLLHGHMALAAGRDLDGESLIKAATLAGGYGSNCASERKFDRKVIGWNRKFPPRLGDRRSTPSRRWHQSRLDCEWLRRPDANMDSRGEAIPHSRVSAIRRTRGREERFYCRSILDVQAQ